LINGTLPPALSLPDFCAASDGLTEIIRSLRGSAETGIGAGAGLSVPIKDDWGYSRAVREYEQLLMDVRHFPTTSRLQPNVHRKTLRGGKQFVLDHVYELIQDLSNVCAATALPVQTKHSGFVGYATHFNTGAGGPYNALISRDLADIFEFHYKSTKVGPSNVYSPGIDVMASRTPGNEIVSAAFVDSGRYAGVQIRVRVEGYSGTPGVVTVVGTGRMAHGGIAPDTRAWSGRIDGDGDFDMVPDEDGDLCLAVRSIGLPADMKAGTITVQGLLPERLR
jgi:hypothetical protein